MAVDGNEDIMAYFFKYKSSNYNINATIFLTAYLCILVMQQFLIVPIRVAQAAMLFLGLLSVQFYKRNMANQYLVIFFIIYTVGGIISWIFNRNADIQEYLWIISFGGIALLLLNESVSFKVISAFYYLSMGLMCILILLSNGVDNLHMASSRNTISSLGILLFNVYTISAFQNHRRVNIMASVTFVITALLGIGRSGVLLAGMLLLSLLIWDINKRSFHFRNPLYICFIILCTGILCFVLYDTVVYPALYNMSWRGVVSQARVGIWTSYLQKTFSDLSNIIFGANISGNVWLDEFSSNLHNSFLNLHSKYGLGITIMIFTLTFNSLLYFIKKRQLIILIPFLAIIFRAQTDYTNFNGTADFVWYYYMFLPFFRQKLADWQDSRQTVISQ